MRIPSFRYVFRIPRFGGRLRPENTRCNEKSDAKNSFHVFLTFLRGDPDFAMEAGNSCAPRFESIFYVPRAAFARKEEPAFRSQDTRQQRRASHVPCSSRIYGQPN